MSQSSNSVDGAVARPAARPAKRQTHALGGRWLVSAIQVALILFLLLIWDLLVRAGVIAEFFFGSPTKMLQYLSENILNGYLLWHSSITLYEQLVGFVVGTVIGSTVGLTLWWSPLLSRVLEPFAVVLNATPKIVMAPIIIMWFGIGITSKVMIAIMICTIVAWLAAYDGTRSIDNDQTAMLTALGGRRWDVFTRIVIPSAMPWILSTMRINIGLALIGAIAGEFLSSTQGLGYLVESTAKSYEMSHTLAVLLVISVLAAAQYYVIGWLESRFFPWLVEPELEFMT